MVDKSRILAPWQQWRLVMQVVHRDWDAIGEDCAHSPRSPLHGVRNPTTLEHGHFWAVSGSLAELEGNVDPLLLSVPLVVFYCVVI